ncbi:amino acid ABC transporter substrate-binding protein [Methylobacterium sp. GC_Met_2]|uniref:amino acid ABC transporter substrate-binding protein n=1 Tax=Methylobacterium sp. GC_Met_2 TaxID=2937376 RepID=UPI00226BB4A3|nr:amino acid ABC transporter substrate-binding protein [Methylobacterium sp. GC_Met_2]
MRRMLAVVAAVLLTASLAQAQDASRTLKKIGESNAISLGFRDSSTPLSYLDGDQKPVGYAIDICLAIVEAVKKDLKLDKLDVRYVPVTSSTRIPLIANGTIDLECGSTTNNIERQKQVGYTYTHFLTASRFVSKAAAGLRTIEDLRGKTIVSTSGSTNIKQASEVNSAKGMGMTILPAKDHAEAFLMVETGRAVAFVMDDVLLSSLIASAKVPKDYVLSQDAFSLPEPYGIMLPRGDVGFKKVVDEAVATLFKSAAGKANYDKWFNAPIPPRGLTLNVPMSAALQKAYAEPSDSPDPASY